MQPEQLIQKINSSVKLEDLVDVFTMKEGFNNIMKVIHPDVCTLPGAEDAVVKMNGWKALHENGKEYSDDLGGYKTNYYWVDFPKSTLPNLQWSKENFINFKNLDRPSDNNFKQYIPNLVEELHDGTIRFHLRKRSIPLTDLQLPQEHVNWILNRLLEYSAYLSTVGFVHGGLTPESVFISPEDHGIQIVSFYHLAVIGRPIKTISGKFAAWYPDEVKQNKIAISAIDIELSKRIAAYLLGEKSGSVTKLRKTHKADVIDFLTAHTELPIEAMYKWKEVLAANFPKQFHSLNI